MSYVLSERSLSRLEGINDKLIKVVKSAIDYTKVDFGVTCGLRTVEEQKELVESGASMTMNSKHLDGNAVDLVAYVGPKISWELNVYDDVAEAMKTAAMEHDLSIRWGAAWHIDDIREWHGTMEELMLAYIDLRRRQGKRPFIDAPHFEVT
tara:strand:- start:37 stop:489 length:453 start_codon:yes stop_codon:yes gene_type:complete